MSPLAWIVGGAGAGLAIASAAAGGALVSPENPQQRSAEDSHRALAMARVAAYLAAGAGITWGIRRTALPGAAQFAVVLALIAAVLVLDAVVREADFRRW
jgi:hypothetical protein